MKQNWTYKKLGEVATLINGDRGKNYPSTNDFIPFGVPFINAGHIQKGKVDFSEMNYISEEKFDSLRSGKVSKGDILFCLRGSLGKTALVNIDNGAIASSLVIIRSHSDNPQFIQYYLQSNKIKELIQKNNNGSSQPNLSATSVAGFSIFIPPLPEQSRIVSELDLLQSIIDKQKAQLSELDNLAQAVFYDMFGDPVENEKGWEKRTISEVCAPKKDIERAAKYFSKDDEILYFDISSIDSIRNVITASTPYQFGEAPSRAQQIVVMDDILISLVRPNLNNVAVVKNDEENMVASTGFCVLRASEKTETPFLFFIVKMKSFTDYLMQRVSGANYPAVREDDVTGYKTILPPLTLQQSFAAKIEAIEKQKAAISQSIEESEKLFNFTMDKYFG